MKVYQTNEIKNIALLGNDGSGIYILLQQYELLQSDVQ